MKCSISTTSTSASTGNTDSSITSSCHSGLASLPSSTPTSSTSPSESAISSLRRRIAADDRCLKTSVQRACDLAHQQLRRREQQLLRVLDAAASRRSSALWDRHSCVAATTTSGGGGGGGGVERAEEGVDCVSVERAESLIGDVTVTIDSHALSSCIETFARVHIDGLALFSDSASGGWSLPSGLEDYGAEEHVVMHKPLPVDRAHVRVVAPRALPSAVYQMDNDGGYEASTLTPTSPVAPSFDDSFELLSTSSSSQQQQQQQLFLPAAGAANMISVDLMEHSGSEASAAASSTSSMSIISDVLVPHPLADQVSAWLRCHSSATAADCSDGALYSSTDSGLACSMNAALTLNPTPASTLRSKWLLAPPTDDYTANQWRRASPQATPTDRAAQPIGTQLLAPFNSQANCVSWTAGVCS